MIDTNLHWMVFKSNIGRLGKKGKNKHQKILKKEYGVTQNKLQKSQKQLNQCTERKYNYNTLKGK